MAIADDPAQCAHSGCELTQARLRPGGLKSLAPKLLTISAVTCAMALAACARNPVQHEFNLAQHDVMPAPVCKPSRPRFYSVAPRHTEPRTRRPDPALLEPQLAPDCEYKKADIKAVDPDEWARLKTEYERQCYRDAERAARERLGDLQAVVR